MKALTNFCFRLGYLSVIAVLLISCTKEITPSPAPGYGRFTPEEGSLFEIEFDYPENWSFLEDPSYKLNTYLIYDPIIQPPPSRPTDDDQFGSREWGRVIISVYQVSDPLAEMDKLADAIANQNTRVVDNPDNLKVIDIIGTHSQVEILENISAEIDGARSRQVTTRLTREWEGKKDITIGRSVFFARGDRLYHFDLSIPESDKDNEFGKAFEYVLSSIRFIR